MLVPGAQWEERRAALDRLRSCPRLSEELLLSDDFLIARAGRLEVYWLPFERLNAGAELVVVGLTPGYSQMQQAFIAALDALDRGLSLQDTMAHVDRQASFAGSMRANMVRMLDEVGLARALGLESSSQLFSGGDHLLHTTSALRYPVFVSGGNYGGKPDAWRDPLLRRYLVDLLAPELEAVPHALVLPLGKAVEGCLRFLAGRRLLEQDRCLFGFPHPSGSNGHRVGQFAENRDALTHRIATWAVDRKPENPPVGSR